MKEHGICAKCKKSVGCPYADDRITGCKNFVLEPELKLTNEENLRQCDTEQLAEFIYCLTEVGDYYAGNGAKKISQYAKEDANDKNHVELIHGNRDFDELVEWLKQPHQKE